MTKPQDVVDQTAALIAKAKRDNEYCPRRGEHSNGCGCEPTTAYLLAKALERAQGIIDGVRAHRKWWLARADEAEKAGTEAADHNAWVYRRIIEDLDRALSTQVKPDGE